MPASYTPPVIPVFLTFPVSIPLAGELISIVDLGNFVLKPTLESLSFLKMDLDEDKGVMAALQIKLGLPVINSLDVAIPTYATPFLLTGTKTHHAALEALDDGVEANSVALVNVNANVGGNVTSAAPPSYASSLVIISNGDSHHTAIEKLEDYDVASRAIAITASSDASTALSTAVNTAAKVGVAAELAPPFTYTSTELIVNGDTLKIIAEKLDAYVEGNRKQTDAEFAISVRHMASTFSLAALHTFYETFYDTLKAHGSTTATLNTRLREASGDGDEYIALTTITASPPHASVAMVWEITGTVTFSVNLIGSLTPVDFMPVPSQLTYVVPTSGAGSTLVVKAVISGAGSRIHRLAVFTKP